MEKLTAKAPISYITESHSLKGLWRPLLQSFHLTVEWAEAQSSCGSGAVEPGLEPRHLHNLEGFPLYNPG